MKKTHFSILKFSRLKQEAFLALCESTQVIIMNSHQFSVDPNLKLLEKQLSDSIAEMRKRVNKKLSSDFTKSIQELEEIRDRNSQELLREVKHHRKSSKENLRLAAELLHGIIKPYGTFYNKAQDVQTSNTKALVAEISSSAELSAALVTLNIKDNFDLMASSNESFDMIYLDRVNEKGSKQEASNPEARPNLLQAYRDICDYIQIVNKINPNDAINSIFNNLDILRKQYKALANTAKPKDKETLQLCLEEIKKTQQDA
jgi:hypothetical protein